MSNRIKILDPITANQIAAGEVVERPASVVKELVENAVDAGASKIEVEVIAAGVELIRVTDNGCGMQREDAVLAFQRHATSKISSSSDLGEISTLGFRGEALPSIASVSNMEAITREANCLEGTRLLISGGKIDQVQDAGCPVGTTFFVRDLFFNTPARRKFLKSDATELGQISDVMNRLAMAYPKISFKFINQGRVLLHTSGNGSLLETVSQVYGRELARDMVPISVEGELALGGLLSKPQHTRSTRAQQTFFINGRYIRSKALTEAVAEGYHTLIPSNRYPIVVLNLHLQPNMVDVNVHPTKLEVRFSKEASMDFIADAIRDALTSNLLIPGLENKSVQSLSEPTPVSYQQATRDLDLPLFTGEETYIQSSLKTVSFLHPFTNSEAVVPSETTIGAISPDTTFTKSDTNKLVLPKSEQQNDASPITHATPNEVFYEANGVVASSSKLPDLDPLGQIDLTYIVAKGLDGLYIIDQHAAHERLNYEELWSKAADGQLEAQLLLDPITLELTNQEMELLVENIFQFSDLGLLLEHFGGNTFLLRGYPTDIDNPQELIRDLLELFTQGEKKIEARKLREEIIYMLACKSSITANKRLSTSEMEHLLWRLGQAENPFSCPHGRPTIIAISVDELAKRFQRV
ncbi:MAG TPA: DNA mismatch repair endonuclease MutL [Candidatus Deferrimicrobium sp.]|nr:DNA mismatch repair endonuclease MutL [Candidatus Deferrimicrobium sp.]